MAHVKTVRMSYVDRSKTHCPKTDGAIRKAKKCLSEARKAIDHANALAMPDDTAAIIKDDIEGICEGLDALLAPVEKTNAAA